jgi:PhnB protein
MGQKAKPIPEGFHSIIPHLVVKGANDAISFYKKAFGAQELSRSPAMDGKRLMHAMLRIGDSVVFLADEFPEMGGCHAPSPQGGSPVTINLYVEDVDKIFNQAVAGGAKARMAPANMFWGDRYSQIVDPFGHIWAIATHLEDVSPEESARRAKEFFSKPPAAKA